MAKITTVRVFLALATIKSWYLHQLYVNDDFLHDDLQENIYMSFPRGVTRPKHNQVLKLLEPLYGLKQASKK